MHAFPDINGKYLVLLPEVWKHIIEGHPEIEKRLANIGQTLLEPMLICRSRKMPDRCLYYRRLNKKLFFVVVIDITKAIVKTCYISDRIKEGEILWPEKK